MALGTRKFSVSVMAWLHLTLKWKEDIGNTWRTPLLYGAGTWATKTGHTRRLEKNETRMWRWTREVTKKDKIRNEHARGSVTMAPELKSTGLNTPAPKMHVHTPNRPTANAVWGHNSH